MQRGFKRGMVLVMAASMLMQACTGGATSQASSQSAAKVSDLNLVDPDGKATTIHGFTKEGLPVPYVDLVEYMHTVYDPKNVFSLSSQGSGAYKISNAKGEMTVDTAKDTLHSDKIEQFLYNDQRLDPTDTNSYVYEHIIATEYRESPKALDIDFSKYGIDIIEEGGRVYFPLTTAADLTGVAYINTVYSDNKIYQNYSINKPDVKWLDELTVIETVGVSLSGELGIEVEVTPAEGQVAVEHSVRVLIADSGTVVGIDDTVSVDILVFDITRLLGSDSVVRISAYDCYVVVKVLLGEQTVSHIEVIRTDGMSLAADGIAGNEFPSGDVKPLVAVVGETAADG